MFLDSNHLFATRLFRIDNIWMKRVSVIDSRLRVDTKIRFLNFCACAKIKATSVSDGSTTYPKLSDVLYRFLSDLQ